MLELIKKIDNAWWNADVLFNVNPIYCNGYFDFRNQVVLRYNRQNKKGDI